MTNYISDIDHYKQVLSKILNVKRFLWIGTADIKDLYMDLSEDQLGLKTKQTLPLLGVIAKLIERGVEVNIK